MSASQSYSADLPVRLACLLYLIISGTRGLEFWLFSEIESETESDNRSC